MGQKVITIFGGTGFLGSYIAGKLAKENFRLKLVSPNPENGKHLLPKVNFGNETIFNKEKAVSFIEKLTVLVHHILIIMCDDWKNLRNLVFIT